MDHKEILLKLLEIQVGITPPKELSLDEALLQLDAIDPEMKHSMRFHRAAKFITDLLANSASEIERLQREHNGLSKSWDLLEAVRLRLIRENAALESKLAAAEAAREICRLYLISGYKPDGKKVSLREAIDAAKTEVRL